MQNRVGRAIAIACAAVAVVAGTSIAFGAIPGDDEPIRACVDHKGRLRVIDAASPKSGCSKHEKPLTWSRVGPSGPAGPGGADGVAGWEVVNTATPHNDEPIKTAVAECPEGKHVVGGGAVTGVRGGIHVTNSFPQTNFSTGEPSAAWEAVAEVSPADGRTWSLRAYAICAAISAGVTP